MGRRKMSTEQFVQRAIEIHGIKYDYSETIFERIDKHLNIICPNHGIFSQVAGSHVRGYGCNSCGSTKNALSTESFIVRAKAVHGERYGYDRVVYTNWVSKVSISCPDHGDWMCSPGKHIDANHPTGCPKCANKYQTTEDFIKKAIATHGNKYDYSHVCYMNDTTKVEILCQLHGVFRQLPSNHHSLGQGCPTCGLDIAKENVGYINDVFFRLQPEQKGVPASLYYVKMVSDDEEFYKVGITTRDNVRRRFDGIDYKVEILEVVRTTLYEAYVREQQILKMVHKHTPSKKFHGWTECFDVPLSVKLANCSWPI